MADLQTLIDRWRKGDSRAAESIYNLHQARVYRLAYGLLGNPEDAEEAAQDALTYALTNIHHFDEARSAFPTWLHMITVSRCRDLFRKRRLPTVSLADWLSALRRKSSEDQLPEEKVIQAEEEGNIWQAIQELSPALREAIILRHWGGHTYQEIADIVGCPIRTAQSRVRLAYGQLQGKIRKATPQSTLEGIQ
jgi:RNA polymerase sigma-70 factor (ECF subfamily)